MFIKAKHFYIVAYVLLMVLGIFSFKDAQASTDVLNVTKVVSVYDGDTFRVDIEQPIGTHPLFTKNIPIRLKGVDTPELRGKCSREVILAKEAKALTEDFLRTHKVVLTDLSRGKYFRVVAYVKSGTKDLSKILIDNGLAVPYDGGKKTKDWCKD